MIAGPRNASRSKRPGRWPSIGRCKPPQPPISQSIYGWAGSQQRRYRRRSYAEAEL